MFPKFSVVVSHFRCQSPDGRHFAFNMGFFDNTEHGTCAELGEFSTHNPTHKMLDAVEVRSSSLLVPTIFLHHLASLTSLRKAPNGSIKRADPEGMMFRTSSNPTSGEFWAAHFYGTGVLRASGRPWEQEHRERSTLADLPVPIRSRTRLRVVCFNWIRRSDHRSHPSAKTCCFFSSLKTLAMPRKGTGLPSDSMSRVRLPLAGFQVIMLGRFCVIAEAFVHGQAEIFEIRLVRVAPR